VIETGLSKDQMLLLDNIFATHLPEADVFLFGSRATGRFKPFSDVDLAIDMQQKKIPIDILTKLADSFEASDLPFKVDLVDLNDVSPEFRKLIEHQKLSFREGMQSG